MNEDGRRIEDGNRKQLSSFRTTPDLSTKSFTRCRHYQSYRHTTKHYVFFV